MHSRSRSPELIPPPPPPDDGGSTRRLDDVGIETVLEAMIDQKRRSQPAAVELEGTFLKAR